MAYVFIQEQQQHSVKEENNLPYLVKKGGGLYAGSNKASFTH